MGKDEDELRRKLFGGNKQANVFPAVVIEVNEDEFTCTVRQDDAVDYYDVRLRGLVNPDLKGVAFIPKAESVVLVCRIAGSNELFVCLFTEIDKVIFINENMSFTLDQETVLFEHEKISLLIESDKISLDVDGSTAELSKDGIVLNGGDLGGLIKIQELTDKINTLIDTFNKHTHMIPSGTFLIGAQAGVPNPAPVSVQKTTDIANDFNKGDYENEKVKH
jgi:hypothetical protein